MTSTGMAAANSVDQVAAATLLERIEQSIDQRHDRGFERLEHVWRQCTDDLPPHARVIRGVVEDQARRVMRVER